ncbi:hypothetical protein IMG5_202690 [Ichthyophthirius multifiliis]|uniref:B box-type domain-containing protein n=1 Tax=Ichthyophthirius multifiliis TaxID=5932 RepID=G0R667_ICHMU|nr:hypothetical protein IMG5_202690 [Ichthyophthirius multifiliis]EGR27031.1 hypothetical protein IMG5_202690 [Ichthyophthirius multifiliis]|eukprot:XP_004023915.1 hypothetical protein IMG5_202690 [Ichthyophthirius multifiliis]
MIKYILNLKNKIKKRLRLCLRHNLPLKYYCETYEELICDQCTIQGPHNTQVIKQKINNKIYIQQLHRISTLQDAFNRRASKISYAIENNLVEKSKLLKAQLHRVEYRMEEIQYITSIIERDSRVEFGGILERLNNAEGTKLSLLLYDIEQLQRFLNKINELGQSFYDLTKEPVNYIPFLRQARKIWEDCNQYIQKPIQTQINVYPYDLPKEFQEIKAQLKQIDANDALINLKDEIIWKLIQEGNEKESFKSVQEFEEQMNNEIQEWAKLAEVQTEKLQKFQLVCSFCNKNLEEKNVNKSCSENKNPYNPSCN